MERRFVRYVVRLCEVIEDSSEFVDTMGILQCEHQVGRGAWCAESAAFDAVCVLPRGPLSRTGHNESHEMERRKKAVSSARNQPESVRCIKRVKCGQLQRLLQGRCITVRALRMT